MSVSERSFAGGLWDAFSAYPSQQSDGGVLARGRIGAFSAFTPSAPLGGPSFAQGGGVRAAAQTRGPGPFASWGASQVILCIGPFPRARTAAATGAAPQSRATHESPPQTAPRPRAATPVAARPAPEAPLARSYATASVGVGLCGRLRSSSLPHFRRDEDTFGNIALAVPAGLHRRPLLVEQLPHPLLFLPAKGYLCEQVKLLRGEVVKDPCHGRSDT